MVEKSFLKRFKSPLQNGPSKPGRAAGFALYEKGFMFAGVGWRCSK
jgi:hypothetical protein